MKKLLIAIFVTIFTLFLSSCNKYNVDNELKKVVEIECIKSNGSLYATGFFINNEGLILTNKHVVNNLDNDCTIKVRLENDDVKDAMVLDISNKYDLALIKIDYNSDYFTFCEKFKIGDKVHSFGNPKGYGITLYEGIISSTLKNVNYNDKSILAIQTNIEIYDGCSGGPLINENGSVVGIMTFRIKDNGSYISGLSFGIPSMIIDEYIKEKGEKKK